MLGFRPIELTDKATSQKTSRRRVSFSSLMSLMSVNLPQRATSQSCGRPRTPQSIPPGTPACLEIFLWRCCLQISASFNFAPEHTSGAAFDERDDLHLGDCWEAHASSPPGNKFACILIVSCGSTSSASFDGISKGFAGHFFLSDLCWQKSPHPIAPQ
jgi:hypothetical protein